MKSRIRKLLSTLPKWLRPGTSNQSLPSSSTDIDKFEKCFGELRSAMSMGYQPRLLLQLLESDFPNQWAEFVAPYISSHPEHSTSLPLKYIRHTEQIPKHSDFGVILETSRDMDYWYSAPPNLLPRIRGIKFQDASSTLGQQSPIVMEMCTDPWVRLTHVKELYVVGLRGPLARISWRLNMLCQNQSLELLFINGSSWSLEPLPCGPTDWTKSISTLSSLKEFILVGVEPTLGTALLSHYSKTLRSVSIFSETQDTQVKVPNCCFPELRFIDIQTAGTNVRESSVFRNAQVPEVIHSSYTTSRV